jgi:hypothetical protein
MFRDIGSPGPCEDKLPSLRPVLPVNIPELRESTVKFELMLRERHEEVQAALLDQIKNLGQDGANDQEAWKVKNE